MTWARRARLALYTAAFTWLGWHGAAALFAGVWALAAAIYALALVVAGLAYAEWSTAAAYADAVEAAWPPARPAAPTPAAWPPRCSPAPAAVTAGGPRSVPITTPGVPSRQEQHPVHATPTPAPAEPYRDAELWRLLAVTVDSDRGESPFGWSDLPAVETGATDA